MRLRHFVDSFKSTFRWLAVIASFLATKIAYAMLGLMGANPPPDSLIVKMSSFFGLQPIHRLIIAWWWACFAVSQIFRGTARFSPWDVLLLITPLTLWIALGIAAISAMIG